MLPWDAAMNCGMIPHWTRERPHLAAKMDTRWLSPKPPSLNHSFVKKVSGNRSIAASVRRQRQRSRRRHSCEKNVEHGPGTAKYGDGVARDMLGERIAHP